MDKYITESLQELRQAQKDIDDVRYRVSVEDRDELTRSVAKIGMSISTIEQQILVIETKCYCCSPECTYDGCSCGELVTWQEEKANRSWPNQQSIGENA